MIIASSSITLAQVNDGSDGNGVKSVNRYYILKSSAPSKPTSNPPDGWTTTEPTYTSGSTDSLYFCDLTTFSDGTWAYSTVSKSSSYEAAKEAWNKAQNAQDTAEEASKVATNYMNFDETDGLVVGNMTADTLGNNVRIDNDSVDIRSGSNVLATFAANAISLGRAAVNAVIELCGGVGKIIAKKDTDFVDSSLFNKVLMLSKFFQFRSREIWLNTVNRDDYAMSDDDVPTAYSSDAFASVYIRSRDGEASGTGSALVEMVATSPSFLNASNSVVSHSASIDIYAGNVDGTTSGYARIEASDGSTTATYTFDASKFSSGAPVYEQGTSLSDKYAAKSHTHSYAAASHSHTAVNGVTPEWSGSVAYKDTGWIAAWNSNGTKIKALNKINLLAAVSANGHYGMAAPGNGAAASDDSAWIRTTSAGLLPYKTGGGSSQLGTSGWPFSRVYSQNYYGGGDILLFSGNVLYKGNLAAGGSFETALYRSYKCFVAILSNWAYVMGYRWDVNAGISMSGMTDEGAGSGSWSHKASFSAVGLENGNVKLTLVAASTHKLLSSGTSHEGYTRNVLYVLGIF